MECSRPEVLFWEIGRIGTRNALLFSYPVGISYGVRMAGKPETVRLLA
jgi:hypothetical protein